MAKKLSTEATASAPAAKRTAGEKTQRKADKAQRKVAKVLTDDHDEKKASQKQTLKAAAKQLQKELDTRMNEMVTRIRKETKAKLKEVVKEATRRLDVDTGELFEQALHTIMKHYDSLPAPAAADDTPAAADKKAKASAKASKTTALATNVATGDDPAPKRARSAAAKKPAAPVRSSGRPKSSAASKGPELSTPLGTANDSVAVDNV